MTVSKLFQDGKKPNILLIITDQERSLQHWPRSFYDDHLPSMSRLLKHGLEFQNYFTNSCMCSPSRATLLTSQFPVVTGVTTTGSPEPSHHLPRDIVNMATVLQAAGYHAEWHGKWHLGGNPSDYGFHGWQPPDAGNYLSLNDTLGGGDPNNDGRFLQELCNFLDSYHQNGHNNDKPFFLVASFVNPHDVYVAQHEPTLGYTEEDFDRIKVPLPTNWREDTNLNGKPRCQGKMSIPYVTFENTPEDYIQFYAYLHTVVDTQIGRLLDKLEQHGMTDSTLILRTSDHGEQGLSHSLVEKFFNAYEESIHIPLIVSNPVAFPKAAKTDALASHIDLLPTLAHLLKISPLIEKDGETKSLRLVGKDLSPVLNGQETSVQESIHSTYDDIPCRGTPSIVRCIRTQRFKYAVYFTKDGKDADWELYDLEKDPLENSNVAGTETYANAQRILDAELLATMKERGTLPTRFDWPPRATKHSRGIGE